MQIEASDGKTVMVGPVADQARLRGILNRISSLNLVLLSIDMLPDTDSAGTAS